jgi:nucleotide-binding universal stress UspA family protein
MTFLVPTDFSDLSRVAVIYAAGLAKTLNAKIVLASVININPTSETLLHSKKLEEEMTASAQQDADELTTGLREMGVDVVFHSVVGFPFDEVIDQMVTEHKADMIVMGSKGATGLKKVLLGSNAVAVINNSSVPVVVVPGGVTYSPVQKIVYATDMSRYHDETKTVALFARLFNAGVQLLHVIPKNSVKQTDEEQLTAELIRLTDYPKISFHVSKNDHIAEEVDRFVAETNADMLAMFTHRLDFYEKLFGRSVTRQLAFHGKVPLLTFNKTTLL